MRLQTSACTLCVSGAMLERRSKLSQLKHAVAWWCVAGKGLEAEELIRTIKQVGYAGIEMIEEEYWPLLQEEGLTIVSLNGHQSIESGLNRRENHARIEDEVRAKLALAQQWGIPNLICFSGNRAGLDDERGIEVTAEGLSRVAKAAEESGVNLVLELLNSRVDHPDYQCDKSAWGIQVIERVNSPRVKLLYDIYHAQIMEGDLIRTIQQYHQHFAHYHLAGNPGRNEPDATQEINYPPILQTIASTGFTGFIGHEFVPRGDVVTALKNSLALDH